VAHRALWMCGFELGPARHVYNNSSVRGFSVAQQDTIFVQGASQDIQDADTDPNAIVHSGRYAYMPARAGFGDATAAVGFKTRTQDVLWQHVWIHVTGFDNPGNVALNDRYIVARLTSDSSISEYYEFICEVTGKDASGNPNLVAFELAHYDGTNHTEVFQSGNFSIPSGWVLLAFKRDFSTGQGSFYVNGTQVGTNFTFSSTANSDEVLLYALVFIAGKGSDGGLRGVFDDLLVTDSASTDSPLTDYQIILQQPICNVENEWTGDYRDVDDENDAADPGGQETNVITPTALDDRETFKFATVAGTTPTIMGARLSHIATGNAHGLSAWILGASQRQDDTSPPGRGYTDLVTGDSYWAAGWQFPQTPEPTPQDWTPTLANDFRGGVIAVGDASISVGEVYLQLVGINLTRPAKTPDPASPCSTGEAVPPPPTSPVIDQPHIWAAQVI